MSNITLENIDTHEFKEDDRVLTWEGSGTVVDFDHAGDPIVQFDGKPEGTTDNFYAKTLRGAMKRELKDNPEPVIDTPELKAFSLAELERKLEEVGLSESGKFDAIPAATIVNPFDPGPPSFHLTTDGARTKPAQETRSPLDIPGLEVVAFDDDYSTLKYKGEIRQFGMYEGQNFDQRVATFIRDVDSGHFGCQHVSRVETGGRVAWCNDCNAKLSWTMNGGWE